MLGEIIAIGNELTSGRIANTTSGFAARHLFASGYEIHAMHTIGDSPNLIGEVLKAAIERVDFVIVTGGLGATDDDLTTEAVACALERPTIPNLELLSQIRSHLDAISASPVSPLEKLAWLPQGAEALTLQARISGYQLVHAGKPIFFLPGVPHQMESLLLDQVLPRLALWNQGRHLVSFQRIFKTLGMEEAAINRLIVTLNLDRRIDIGYYPVFPEVHVSLTLRSPVAAEAASLFAAACRSVHVALGDVIYGQDQDSLAGVTGRLLEAAGLRLATAESCTGGLIGHLLTQVPGSSHFYLGGVIAYANSIKIRSLGIGETLVAVHGAVSREVAEAMATGMRHTSGADIAVSVTGIAGPDGGTMAKPVGTVFIGMATENMSAVHHFYFSGSRQQIQEITAKTALDLIRRYLLQQSRTE
jgi:nicotinamide-nucleotide amidase